MARHCSGLYSGAVWPAPCIKHTHKLRYYFHLNILQEKGRDKFSPLTFIVAKVRKNSFLLYLCVYLREKKKEKKSKHKCQKIVSTALEHNQKRFLLKNGGRFNQMKTNPAICPFTFQGLQPSSTVKLRCCIHFKVAMYGTVKSWSPL